MPGAVVNDVPLAERLAAIDRTGDDDAEFRRPVPKAMRTSDGSSRSAWGRWRAPIPMRGAQRGFTDAA
jgi:hypothetical protein